MSESPARHFRAELLRARPLSPNVRSLVFRAEAGDSLSWIAGQYVELELGPGLRKPYSIASAMGAHGPDEFEIAVTLGSGAEPFEVLAPGARLAGFGPAGNLRRSRAVAQSAFVATGTGLSPLRAMIQDELSRGGAAPMLLLFGCRAEPDILWRDELSELASRHGRFRFEPTLSRAEAGWGGRRGWVQEHLHELIAPLGRGGGDIFVCGTSSMVSECVRRLESEVGVPRERIFTERC